MSTSVRYLTLIGALLMVLSAVAVIVEMCDPATQALLVKEGGVIESATVCGYVACLALVCWRCGNWSSRIDSRPCR